LKLKLKNDCSSLNTTKTVPVDSTAEKRRDKGEIGKEN
jgi:hypothetical protein|tara:strand:- start:325 stop:438 length:114 start_codon:yes stop_codon:yes gene_type:complete